MRHDRRKEESGRGHGQRDAFRTEPGAQLAAETEMEQDPTGVSNEEQKRDTPPGHWTGAHWEKCHANMMSHMSASI